MDGGEGGGGGAVAIGGDQLGDLALVEALAQAPRTLCVRSRGAHGASARHGAANPQVSGLYRVRVSGKYLHSYRLPLAMLGEPVIARTADRDQAPVSVNCDQDSVVVPPTAAMCDARS